MTYLPPANGGRINATITGNTVGVGGLISTGTMALAGGNNVTLSQNGNTISIVAGAGGAGFSAGVSTLGNTLGNTGMATNQLVFAGGNNVTLSQSTSPSGNTVSFAAGGLTNVNLSAGTTSNNLSNMVFSNSNGVSFGLNGSTLTASVNAAGGGNTIDFYQNMDRGTSVSLAVPYATNAATLMLQRLNQENNEFGANITANTVLLNMSANMSVTSNMSSAHTISAYIGLYSDNNTALSLINSASSSWGMAAATGNTGSYHGPRWLSFVSSQWSSQPAFSQGGEYVFGVLMRASSYAPPLAYVGQNYMGSVQRSGTLGAPTQNATTLAQGNYWNAMYGTATTALPAIISSHQVNRNNATAIFMPHIVLNNRYSGTF